MNWQFASKYYYLDMRDLTNILFNKKVNFVQKEEVLEITEKDIILRIQPIIIDLLLGNNILA